MTEIVRGERVSLRYPYTSRPTLQDFSGTLAHGERVLLLGASGSGKSSLSLCLNGLIPHSIEADLSGRLEVFGRETTWTTPAQLARHVGIVFQDPESQFCTLTVEDEVAFGLENLKVPRGQLDTRIEQALERVGMAGERHTRLDRVSGGMKQRVALAALLAMEPDLLILDEVTSNLDPAGAAQVFGLVRDLTDDDPERTFLIVEHRLDSIIAFITRVWVLDEEGRLAHDAPPRQLFARHGRSLEKAGIWQPTAMSLAHHLQQEGAVLPSYPLTVEEACDLLRTHPDTWETASTWAAPGHDPGPDASVAPAVELHDVTFTYKDGTRAMDGVDLEVRRGEVLALLGPNGAGKTTLAQMMVGLLRPQQGTVRILGEATAGYSVQELAQRCGFVFQNPEHQFVTDQVFDEVAFALRQRELNETTVEERVESLLSRLDLAGRRTANPFELSQGQKRRLSVATMLVSDTSILVLDEPTFGQDARNTRELVAELRRLNREGVTLVLVTHDMDLVWELAQRVAVMADGRLLRVAPVEDVFADRELLQRANLKLPPRAVIAKQIQKMQVERRRKHV